MFHISEENPFILGKLNGFGTECFYQRDGSISSHDMAVFGTQVGMSLTSNPPPEHSLRLIPGPEGSKRGEDDVASELSASRPITPLTGLAPSRSVTPVRELLQYSGTTPKTS